MSHQFTPLIHYKHYDVCFVLLIYFNFSKIWGYRETWQNPEDIKQQDTESVAFVL